MPTMAYRKAPSVMVLAHGEQPPDGDEWSAWVDAMAEHRCSNVLVWTDGGVPNAVQRTLITSRLGQVKATVLSESSMAKPVSTVLRWVGHDIRVYGFRELDDALASAGVPAAERELVLRASLEARIETLGGRTPTEALTLDMVRQRVTRRADELAELIRRTA